MGAEYGGSSVQEAGVTNRKVMGHLRCVGIHSFSEETDSVRGYLESIDGRRHVVLHLVQLLPSSSSINSPKKDS